MESSETTIWILVLAAECGGGTWQFSYPRLGFTLLLTVRWTPYWTEFPVASSPEACTRWQGLFLIQRCLVRAQVDWSSLSLPLLVNVAARKERLTVCHSVCYSLPPPWPGSCSSYLIRKSSHSFFWATTSQPSVFLFLTVCTSSQWLFATAFITSVIKHMVSYWLGRAPRGGKTFHGSGASVCLLV